MQPARAPVSTHATRTIFGMPALDIAGLKAAEIARQATAAAAAPAASPAAAPPVAAAPSAPAPTAPAPAPVVAASAAAQAAQDRQGATKTIFGVPAPRLPEKMAEKPAERAPEKIVEKPKEEAAKGRAAADRKTGARKTLVPAPAIIPPAAGSPAGAADAAPAAPMAAAATESAEASRTTHQGYGGGPAAGAEVVPVRVAPIEERTAPVRAITAKKSRAIPVWTYVGVGFLFGLALLGIYQLVGVLAH